MSFGEIKDLNFNNDGMHQSQRIGNLSTDNLTCLYQMVKEKGQHEGGEDNKYEVVNDHKHQIRDEGNVEKERAWY